MQSSAQRATATAPGQPGSWVSSWPASFPAAALHQAALHQACPASTHRGNRPRPPGPQAGPYRPLPCRKGAGSQGQRERGSLERQPRPTGQHGSV